MNEARIKEFREIRKNLILTGKHLPEYHKIGKEKDRLDDEKYGNLDSLESGAVGMQDIEFLYDYVQRKQCKKVLEIGTLFGTSAYAMILGMLDNGVEEPVVFTCDKYNLFVPCNGMEKHVRYFNMRSRDMLDQIKDERFDFVFADAKFKKGDAAKIKKVCRPMNFITHDYDQKGGYNIEMLEKEFKGEKMKLTIHNNMAYYRQEI